MTWVVIKEQFPYCHTEWNGHWGQGKRGNTSVRLVVGSQVWVKCLKFGVVAGLLRAIEYTTGIKSVDQIYPSVIWQEYQCNVLFVEVAYSEETVENSLLPFN